MKPLTDTVGPLCTINNYIITGDCFLLGLNTFTNVNIITWSRAQHFLGQLKLLVLRASK